MAGRVAIPVEFTRLLSNVREHLMSLIEKSSSTENTDDHRNMATAEAKLKQLQKEITAVRTLCRV